MIVIKRTNSEDQDFIMLVKLLDNELRILDGEEHVFYAQLNKTDRIKQVVVAYENADCVGCGAIREYSKEITEVKRMFVLPDKRNKGVASIILKELEKWGKELKYKKLFLETGKRQPDAIHLYKKWGYKVIPNFGKYENVENSVCFEKEIEL